MRLGRRTAAAFSATTIVLVGLAGGAQAKPAESNPVAVASASCSAGYTRASLPDGIKCLHNGEFCTKSYQTYYHRYGYTCKVGSDGRLRLFDR